MTLGPQFSAWTEGVRDRAPYPFADGAPATHGYRVLSDAEWQAASEAGALVPRSGQLHVGPRVDPRYADEPDAPQHVVRVRLDEGRGWQAKWGGGQVYAVTRQPVPLDDVEEHEVFPSKRALFDRYG